MSCLPNLAFVRLAGGTIPPGGFGCPSLLHGVARGSSTCSANFQYVSSGLEQTRPNAVTVEPARMTAAVATWPPGQSVVGNALPPRGLPTPGRAVTAPTIIEYEPGDPVTVSPAQRTTICSRSELARPPRPTTI
jgi:hypothetical protein